MKKLPVVFAITLLGVLPFRAAPPTAANQDDQLAALVKEVQAQNAAMAENQAAIEGKLATLAEAVRLARIYASRGGS